MQIGKKYHLNMILTRSMNGLIGCRLVSVAPPLFHAAAWSHRSTARSQLQQRREYRFTRNPGLSNQGDWWQKVVGVGASGYALVKFKGLSFLLPVIKVAKLGPLVSMGASMAAYGYLFGWQFGVGMVSLIFIHELGHGLMMRRLGVPAGPMTFIPFLGASIEMRGRPISAYHESLIALAGPAVGTLATLPLTVYGLSTGSQFALALSHWGCLVNLFNLLPIGSLDGGRVAASLSRWTLPGGVGLCLAGIFVFPNNPVLYLTLFSAIFSTYSRFFRINSNSQNYFKLSKSQQTGIIGSYLGLAVSLYTLMEVNDRLRKSPEELASAGTVSLPKWTRIDPEFS